MRLGQDSHIETSCSVRAKNCFKSKEKASRQQELHCGSEVRHSCLEVSKTNHRYSGPCKVLDFSMTTITQLR